MPEMKYISSSSSFVWHLLTYNIPIIAEDINALIGKLDIINFAYIICQTKMRNKYKMFHSRTNFNAKTLNSLKKMSKNIDLHIHKKTLKHN